MSVELDAVREGWLMPIGDLAIRSQFWQDVFKCPIGSNERKLALMAYHDWLADSGYCAMAETIHASLLKDY